MNNFCFVHIDKMHNGGEMTARYNHDYREADVSNADADLKDLNEVLIDIGQIETENGVRNRTYNEAFHDRIKEIDYLQQNKIRSTAVRGYDIVLTYSRDSDLDIDTWAQKNVEWLKKTFNQAGDGKDNVLSAVLHADEPGNIHIHAFVVPIDPNGRLNARYYTGGYNKMTEHQDSYAKDMEELGLERGIRGSSATHEDIKRFYADLNNAMNKVPEPQKNEMAVDYYNRAIDFLRTAYAANLRREKELNRKSRRNRDIKRAEIKEEYRKMIQEAKKEEEKIISEARTDRERELKAYQMYAEKNIELQSQIESARNQMDELLVQLEDANSQLNQKLSMLGSADELRMIKAKYESFNKNLEHLKESNLAEYNRIQTDIAIVNNYSQLSPAVTHEHQILEEEK